MVLVEGWSPFVSEARVGVIGRPDWRASGTLIESSKEAATTALRENETEGRTCCLNFLSLCRLDLLELETEFGKILREAVGVV